MIKKLVRSFRDKWSPLACVIRGISKFLKKIILEYWKIHRLEIFLLAFWFGRGSLFRCDRFGKCRRDLLYGRLGLKPDGF
jgi:hypothetical protein